MPTQGREYDPEIKDIASYVHNTPIDSELAVSALPMAGNLEFQSSCSSLYYSRFTPRPALLYSNSRG